MNLFDERYHVAREAARARQEMMNEIHKHMRTKENLLDRSEVIECDDD